MNNVREPKALNYYFLLNQSSYFFRYDSEIAEIVLQGVEWKIQKLIFHNHSQTQGKLSQCLNVLEQKAKPPTFVSTYMYLASRTRDSHNNLDIMSSN